MAYADSDARRTYQREWEATHRKKRNRSTYHASWKATQDPNTRREREQEQRFRFRRLSDETGADAETELRQTPGFSLITRRDLTNPRFVVIGADGSIHDEYLEPPERLEAHFNHKKKGPH